MTPMNPAEAPDAARILAALRDARTRLEAADRKASEPVAVIGMGCRFPGAPDLAGFWELLRNGRDAIVELPADRPGRTAGGTPPPRGGYLSGIDGFDPAFFGISPREAESLDPQQRLLLEVGHEALEHAGFVPEPGSATGVFVGIGQNDYSHLALYGRDPALIGPYDGTGNGFCFASGRLSYWLGLSGPNLAVDTACSSSLTAIHLAVQSLRLGECDAALAGGVQLALAPAVDLFLARTGALAPDGRCKAFDAAADGFGRGEGCGMVVLMRLGDALAQGYPVLALIRGSAVNHDGRSSGLTVPNPAAQSALIGRALANARLAPGDIDYLETHGTGTALGDPIEAEALAEAFAGPRRQPLWLGSVKANIGHLEAAAGIAGLIKTVLVLQHREIPPQPGFGTPNPRIPWPELPIAVAARSVFLADGPVRAGVSSFGMAGSNAHVLLEAAPPAPREPVPGGAAVPRLFTLSARSAAALEALRERYRRHLLAHPELDAGDICLTAALGRRHFEERLALVASSPADIAEALAAGRFVRGRADSGGEFRPDRGAGDRARMLTEVAEGYVRGLEPPWSGLFPQGRYRRVALPTYPFQRRPFWVAAEPPRPAIASPVTERLDLGDTAGLCALIESGLGPEARRQARTVIEALVNRHRRSEPSNSLPDWCYGIEWRSVGRAGIPLPDVFGTETAVASGMSTCPTYTWLIFGEHEGLGGRLAAELRGRGQRAVLASPGPRLERLGADAWRVDPERAEDFAAVLAALRADGPPLRGAVHLLGPDWPEPMTVADLEASQRVLCGGALHLLKALVGQTQAPLWLVTRGAVRVGGETPAPFQAPLWGLGRTALLEHPDCRGGLVDLDPAAEPQAAELAALLLAPSGDNQLALRGGAVHAPRLRPAPPEPAALPVRDDAAYLITGGLGAIGLAAARWLARRGARHLLLNGRRAPDPAAERELAELAETGVRVDLIRCDVADEAALRAALADFPVRGVIHGAGVQGRRPLAELTLAELMATLKPKLLGGWALQRLDLELDFFVSLSSVAGVWGSRNQAHYAAANRFLDVLAQYRQSRGEPGASIAWGPWAGTGMATDADRAALAGMGLAALDPEPALELLGALAGRAETVVADVDWERFLPRIELRGPMPLFDELRTAGAAPAAGGSFAAALAELPADQRPEALFRHLRRQVAEVLGFADPEAVDPDQGFFALGMDSMMSVELAERLRRQLGLSLPATLAFDFPNLFRLAEHLRGEIPARDPVPSEPSAAPAGPEADVAERLARLESLFMGNRHVD
jgi:3-oxoacyl-(acyl-carrier-protein) synthase/NAD(P)-dependent dehydrogenase (short-subunit alcohol dehydrogenase family)/acyl carrier protein